MPVELLPGCLHDLLHHSRYPQIRAKRGLGASKTVRVICAGREFFPTDPLSAASSKFVTLVVADAPPAAGPAAAEGQVRPRLAVPNVDPPQRVVVEQPPPDWVRLSWTCMEGTVRAAAQGHPQPVRQACVLHKQQQGYLLPGASSMLTCLPALCAAGQHRPRHGACVDLWHHPHIALDVLPGIL